MKFYNLDTEFTFGKFEGKTVREVLDVQHSYIDWCAINLDHFYISDEVIDEIKEIVPDFSISEEGKSKLSEKYGDWENNQENHSRDDYDDYRPSYEKYGGAYGYDDDTIDSAFEGDPENYWNID
ncbi:MAG: hypothetical protein HC912_12710 [Saprospiraceae bacterium]|nr:hypothetical protein [Saprospiraceae bacterium]